MPAVHDDEETQARIRQIAASLDVLTEDDLILFAGITPATAEAWRRRRLGPPYVLIGTRYFYPRTDAAEFIRAKLRTRPSVSARELL